jgi:molecular chaperone DnaK (HSP70)
MVEEAEKNAESDKARRELIEASNQADSVCADTEKVRCDSFLFLAFQNECLCVLSRCRQ